LNLQRLVQRQRKVMQRLRFAKSARQNCFAAVMRSKDISVQKDSFESANLWELTGLRRTN
jgi:hypothetical protein